MTILRAFVKTLPPPLILDPKNIGPQNNFQTQDLFYHKIFEPKILSDHKKFESNFFTLNLMKLNILCEQIFFSQLFIGPKLKKFLSKNLKNKTRSFQSFSKLNTFDPSLVFSYSYYSSHLLHYQYECSHYHYSSHLIN